MTTTVSNIVLAEVTMPHIIAFNPTTHLYYGSGISAADMTTENWKEFLTDIVTGKNKVILASVHLSVINQTPIQFLRVSAHEYEWMCVSTSEYRRVCVNVCEYVWVEVSTCECLWVHMSACEYMPVK